MTLQLRDIDNIRKTASKQLDQDKRSDMGQYMTPSPVADFMAGMFKNWPEEVRLLDPGAGIGSLSEAFANKFVKDTLSGSKLHVTTFELDTVLLEYLEQNLSKIKGENRKHSVTYQVIHKDFITETAVSLVDYYGFTHSILNPPYKKIASNSTHRKLLHELGIEAPNLYAAFLALSILLSQKGGEIVAIIPRSFCNGLYFRPFRKWLLENAALTDIHIFGSRSKTFKEDNVLQENIILRLVKGGKQGEVKISESTDATFLDYKEREVDFLKVVQEDDSEIYIRIPSAEPTESELFVHTLNELGIEVSTGPVVDFRVKEFWISGDRKDSAPLLYPHHFSKGEIVWPREHKKPNAIRVNAETDKLLMPRGWYLVVKRFSSKEEKRRIVACVLNPEKLDREVYGFENHLNVFHIDKKGIDSDLVYGLSVFLNSDIVDRHFRTFSGHTQVNVTDLRTMRFPERETLYKFGSWARKQKELTRQSIDAFIKEYAETKQGTAFGRITSNT